MIGQRVAINISGREFNLRPFGDLQQGEPGFRLDLWERWLEDARKDTTARFIGMGDYFDFWRTSINDKLQEVFSRDLTSHLEADKLVKDAAEKFAFQLKPFTGRIIGLHEGHHFFTFSDGTTSTQYLAGLLKTYYLSFTAGVIISVKRGNQNGSTQVNIYSTHGCNGAKKVGSDVLYMENNIVPMYDADLYLKGHTTKLFASDALPLTKFVYNRTTGEVYFPIRRRIVVNTGGFMDSYIPQAKTQAESLRPNLRSNYVEKKALPKVTLGWSVVNFKFSQEVIAGRSREHLVITPTTCCENTYYGEAA